MQSGKNEDVKKKGIFMKNIAIITGASSGLGKEFVRQLDEIANLDEIWMIGRNEERLKNTDFQTRSSLRPFCLDLCVPSSFDFLKGLLELETPTVRMLINCAGFGLSGRVDRLSEGGQGSMIDVNCKALTMLTKLCIPYMEKGSRILQTASAGAFLPQPEFAVYAATKSYVLSFSRALYKELLPKHIYVTTICPGPVDTPFFEISSPGGKPAGIKKYFVANPKRVVAHALKASVLKKELAIYGVSMKALYFFSHFPIAGVWSLICRIREYVKEKYAGYDAEK